MTALVVLADSDGAPAANAPVAYASLVTIGSSLAMVAYPMQRMDLPPMLVENQPVPLGAPLVSTASYLITIRSLGEARVELAISFRETNIPFALAIGAGRAGPHRRASGRRGEWPRSMTGRPTSRCDPDRPRYGWQ